jgi:hypothetical protein
VAPLITAVIGCPTVKVLVLVAFTVAGVALLTEMLVREPTPTPLISTSTEYDPVLAK